VSPQTLSIIDLDIKQVTESATLDNPYRILLEIVKPLTQAFRQQTSKAPNLDG
jgi:hypothetical protein